MALTLYALNDSGVQPVAWTVDQEFPDNIVWIDLFSPTKREEEAVEKHIGIDVPTREEMREIEVSNRLYHDSGHLFMTATLLTKFDSHEPENHAVTFILSPQRLITVRYIDPVPFRTYPARIKREAGADSYCIFVGLIEAIINRAADILETITVKADEIAKSIFTEHCAEQQVDHSTTLMRVGQCGDVATKVNESLTSLWRLVAYAQQNIRTASPELQANLLAHTKDISALNDQANFISNKVSFLLDATLGMVSIAQNNIIKIFSIAAVVFLPPTLVASIYGMNFHHMPELDWRFGYPMAIAMMIAAAVLPIWYFKRKKWL